MEIKAVKMYDNGFMTQSFAFGGEEGVDQFDSNIKLDQVYRIIL